MADNVTPFPWNASASPEQLDPYLSEDRKVLPFLDVAAWEGVPAPRQQWVVEDWLPQGQASYLTGPGSSGKSLLGQQLCTSIALGLPFMGVPTARTNALYITAEDDAGALHQRQAAICRALGTSPAELGDKLFPVSLVGRVGNELATFAPPGAPDEFGKVAPIIRASKLFHAIERRAIAHDVGLIVLDNVAHFFAGNENIRNEVAAFMSLLNGLAIRISGAVLLIGHPNKAGDSFSGSTAWENQVRSRLFMETPKEEDGSVLDRDARVLRREKSNYARNGAELRFRWHEWAFVREGDLPADHRAELAETIKASAENAAFLRCLDARNAQERPVSESAASRTFAPREFALMPEGKGFKRGQLEAAMDRLFRTGEIEIGLVCRTGRKDRFGLRRKCADLRADPALTGCADVRRHGAPSAPAHTLIPKGIAGAALGAGAPADDDVIWDDQTGGEE